MFDIVDFEFIRITILYKKITLLFFWSSSLVVRAHTIKCGEMGCPGFEPDSCI